MAAQTDSNKADEEEDQDTITSPVIASPTKDLPPATATTLPQATQTPKATDTRTATQKPKPTATPAATHLQTLTVTTTATLP